MNGHVTQLERQRLAVLDEAFQLAASIDTVRRQLSSKRGSSGGEQRRLRDTLVESSECLVNLLSLLQTSMPEKIKTPAWKKIKAGVEEIRGRFMGTAAGLVSDRAFKVSEKINAILDEDSDSDYAFGLADRLASEVREIENCIQTFGGYSILDDMVRERVAKAQESVKRLAAMAEDVGELSRFGETPPNQNE